jgi:HlyD family secretion protein
MAEEYQNKELNSEDVQEIITSVPSWIVRWGITVIFLVLSATILLSALIEYPDVIRTSLKVNSTNAPKAVIAKQGGKLTSLLVNNGQLVKQDEPLAYFESTARPQDVLTLMAHLKKYQWGVFNKSDKLDERLPTNLNLGEVQADYQIFYQAYLQYQSTQEDGYYLKQIAFLERDLQNVKIIGKQILQQQEIQNREYVNAERDYQAYKKLFEKKVISSGEFRQKENQYLAAKYPLQQTEREIVNNNNTAGAKERELSTLHNTIAEQKAKFIQALNQLLTTCERWMQEYTLRAPVDGRVTYAGIVQKNQNIIASQEVFIINPGNPDFFGEIHIPQYNMGKVRIGQTTLIKLHSFPFEQYGMVRGKLIYVSDVAYKDSIFIAKIRFDRFEGRSDNRQIKLKNGMRADAEIITEESSLLVRFFRNLRKMGTN